MNNIVTRILTFLIIIALLESCANDELTPYYGNETNQPGKVVIIGYSAFNDSLQISVDGKPIEIGKDKKTAFIKKIEKEYEFVYHGKEEKTIKITNKVTKELLRTYHFSSLTPKDTLSFFAKEKLWVDKVTSLKPGILSKQGNNGFKFIFPTQNRYSNSGYEGKLDGIIRKINGQVLGVVENISKDQFSPFIEFPFSSPPTIIMELVKHGTTESYVTGKKITVTLTMSVNKSKLIVLEEKQDANGAFSGVDGNLNLVDYFVFK
ncbi:hypothetical protein LNQ49_02745 [Flavobacterium sp. F-65]|uniref:Lipoprotein n=1 Tax=Flavobacterium pisciphilum TaxID=2893755 RepID=A0ABS8MQU5_9FLAO|nr:hypothetical protein [Flavobacterium sp. F-65]MCC9070517.1 hypothetical protein [Flavobacterium sp. F-65]